MERFSRREPNPRRQAWQHRDICALTNANKLTHLSGGHRSAPCQAWRLGWRGLVIERHRADASERQERTSSHHVLALWERHTFHTEHNDGRGRMARVTKRAGCIDFFPVGILSACRPTGPSEMTVCAFHPEFAKEVEEE